MSGNTEDVFSHKRYDVLDGMRGIAALSVMLYHYTQHIDTPLLHNAGLAVDLFFMLSGFVIAHCYGERMRDLGYVDYLGKRLFRLYPMFIAGIALGLPILFVLTAAGQANNSLSALIRGVAYNFLFLPFFNHFEIVNFAAPDATIGEIFPTNPPLWSLQFELAASAVFPFLYRLNRRQLSRVVVFSFLALMAIGFIYAFLVCHCRFTTDGGWGQANFLQGFPRVLYGFSFGILIHSLANDTQLAKYIPTTRRHVKPYVLYLALVAIFAMPFKLMEIYPVLVILIIAPTLVWAGSVLQAKGNVSVKAARFLGWISYPVYCLHFPIGRAVFFFSDRAHYPPSFAIGASIILTIVSSIFLTRFYEEPARAYLSRKYSRRPKPARKWSSTD